MMDDKYLFTAASHMHVHKTFALFWKLTLQFLPALYLSNESACWIAYSLSLFMNSLKCVAVILIFSRTRMFQIMS